MWLGKAVGAAAAAATATGANPAKRERPSNRQTLVSGAVLARMGGRPRARPSLSAACGKLHFTLVGIRPTLAGAQRHPSKSTARPLRSLASRPLGLTQAISGAAGILSLSDPEIN